MNTAKAKRAMRQLAKEKGISVAEVRREIEIVLEDVQKNPDPAIQKNGKRYRTKGNIPRRKK